MANSLPALADDLPLLHALDVLLRERHVSRAAQRLGITQGAASQRLARLRHHFDDALLVPGRPLMILTPRAQALQEPIATALATVRAALVRAEPFDPATSHRRFTLLGNDLAEVLAFPPLLDAIHADAPGVSLGMERADTDFAERLATGAADLAFLPDFMVRGSLRRVALPPEPFVVLLRRAHPLAKKKKLRLEDYLALGHVLVAPRGLPGSIVDSALERQGKTRMVVTRVQHFLSAAFVVARTDLAVTCPAPLARAVAPELALVSMTPPLALAIDRTSMVWHERAHRDAGHRWLRDRIAERLDKG